MNTMAPVLMVMSIPVPKIEFEENEKKGALPYSLSFSSEYLDSATVDMTRLLPKLVELAEVEKTCDMLSDELERTRRRVNALEYVMIAEMKGTIKYMMKDN